MLDELRTLFAYNRWANARLLDAVAPLTDSELGRDLGGSFPNVAAVRARWDALWDEQQAYLAGVDEASLARDVAYRTFDGTPHQQPLHELIRHVVNHATYHRGQLAAMLRQLGKTPPSTDLARFYREQRPAS